MNSLEKLIDEWRTEYGELKSNLAQIGGKPDSLEYNLLAAEALRLSECIADAMAAQIEAQAATMGGM